MNSNLNKSCPADYNTYFYHPDHLGTATYLTDHKGYAYQFFLNLPFGESMAEQRTGSYENRYKFTGQEFDPETGFYYYGARYYHPGISVFLAFDPAFETTWDAFGYVYNNPVRYVDPSGMFAVDLDDIIKINKSNGQISVHKADGDDIVQLVDDDRVLDSYRYGENGSFKRENNINSDGKFTALVSTNIDRLNKFYKFAAKSHVEFGFAKFKDDRLGVSTTAVLMTDHNTSSVNSLPVLMRMVLGKNRNISVASYSHSHPPTTDGSYNNFPSGFNDFGDPIGVFGDLKTFHTFNLDPNLKGRVPNKASVFSAQRNTLIYYNDKKATENVSDLD